MMKHIPTVAALLVSLATPLSAACSRASLQRVVDRYLEAQVAGRSADVAALAGGAALEYTENGKAVDIRAGVLSQALKLDHNFTALDTERCGAFAELIAATAPHPYVIATRILLAPGSSNSSNSNSNSSSSASATNATSTAAASAPRATLIESIVTDAGDWAFNATGYLYWTAREDWSPIPEGRRDSRADIQAAGDAYFRRFANASVAVPWGTPCARLEGGAYTGQRDPGAETCDLGLPSTIAVTDRRYLVDEVYGVVDLFLGFPGLDRSVPDQPMPDSHLFRVEGGRIRYIHTVSACVQDGCGLSGGMIPTRTRARRVRRQW